MKKIFTRVIGAVLGVAMAIGIGAGIANSRTASEVCAETVTISPNATGTNTSGIWTYSSAKDVGTTNPSTNSGHLRIYPKNTFTISTTSNAVTKIDSIVYTVTVGANKSGKIPGEPTTNDGTYSLEGTWGAGSQTFTIDSTASNCKSVTFTLSNGEGAGNINIETCEVAYTASVAKTPASLALSGTYPTQFRQGDSFSHDGMTVTVTYANNAGTADVTSDAVFSGYDMSTINNNQTVTVSYTENEVTVSTTYSIAVKAPLTITGVTASGDMDNKDYYEGQEWDLTGLYLSVEWSEGDPTTVDLTDLTLDTDYIFDDDTAVIGHDTLTIEGNYQGFDFEFIITGISVNPVASSATFVAGTDLGETTSNNTPDLLTKNGYEISCTNAAFATEQYRIYQNAVITFRVFSGEIGKITMVQCDGSKPLSNLSLNGSNGTWNSSTGIWTGTASSVSFTASAQARASSFVIEIYSPEPTLSLNKNSIKLNTYESDGVEVTASVQNVDNPSFVWTPADDKVTVEVSDTTNDSQTVVIKPNTLEAANTSVVLTITGTELSATVNITIESALTVAEAVSAIDSAAPSYVVQGTAYVKGIVSQVDSFDSDHNSITYWISDDGTTNNQFEVYSGKDFGGVNFTSEEDVKEGSFVVIKGNIKKYNDIYEFNYNNQLVYSSSAILHATENDGVVDSTSIIFETRIAKSAWTSYGSISDYGMMLFKSRKASPQSVKERYDSDPNPENPTKVLVVNDDTYGLQVEDKNEYYSLLIEVNVASASAYDYKFCVSTYIVVNSSHHFLDNLSWSVNSLADKGLVDSALSAEALNSLKSANN